MNYLGSCVGARLFFTSSMTLAEVYHYATQHFDFHQRQLTLGV